MWNLLANADPWGELLYAVVTFVLGWLMKSPIQYGRRKEDKRP